MTRDPVRDAWEQNGRWWSDYSAEGNDFHLQLVAPAVEKLLNIQPGEEVLDIACGNGAFSRRMAGLGARVVGFDFSTSFIECAKERSSQYEGMIDYHVIDATDRDQLLDLGIERFDGAVANMALMDMSNIEPLAEAVPRLLKPGGRFVFSIMHPCFNNPDTLMSMEQEDREGRLVTTRSVKIRRYLTMFSAQGIGIVGQPVPQTYFHRPLSELLRPFLEAGMGLTGLEEAAFKDASAVRGSLSWDHFHDIPPVLAVRLVDHLNETTNSDC
ncbi:MAG: class I SAM-dependent methyltransferase [Candidatus Atribacteria bacterium]|nr:MAG: class I SAM-dependent methyltransferase [Candidatus Atribacteria bacterium]